MAETTRRKHIFRTELVNSGEFGCNDDEFKRLKEKVGKNVKRQPQVFFGRADSRADDRSDRGRVSISEINVAIMRNFIKSP